MKTSQSTAAKAGGDSNVLVTVTEVTEQVGREILESQMEPGAWATALYECGGRRQDAFARYAQIRVRQLTEQRRIRLAKVRSLESRRLTHCMGEAAASKSIAKTIQEMLLQNRRGRSINFVKPKFPLIWLFLLFVGTAGTVASLGRLWRHEIPDSLTHPLALTAILSGVGAVWAAVILRYCLPKRWVMLGWNTGLVVICNLVCLSSLFAGTKVIKNTVVSGHTPLSTPHSETTTILGPDAGKELRKKNHNYLASRDPDKNRKH